MFFHIKKRFWLHIKTLNQIGNLASYPHILLSLGNLREYNSNKKTK
jgi:hypothetical protein